MAAGIWGLSNSDRVTNSPLLSLARMHAHILCWLTGVLTLSVCLQVVEDITEFYKQTYANYKDTKQPALKETLRLIHFGVRTHTWTPFMQLVSLFWNRTHGSLGWLPNLCGLSLSPPPLQLDCCGPTGTVIDAARDICPKQEGLEVLVTKVRQTATKGRWPLMSHHVNFYLNILRSKRFVLKSATANIFL